MLSQTSGKLGSPSKTDPSDPFLVVTVAGWWLNLVGMIQIEMHVVANLSLQINVC